MAITAFLPIFFLFFSGFLVSHLVFRKHHFNFAEKIAVWFCIGLLLAIINSLLLSYFKLFFLLLPLSIIEVIVPAAILAISAFKHKTKISISLKTFKITPLIPFIILIILMVSCFFLATSRPVDFVRNPDEYKYADFGQNIMHSVQASADMWSWMQMYAYGFSLAYFFQIGSFSLFTGQVMSAMFYAMLILSTYLLGSLRSKKTGLIAGLFIAFNPMIFLFSSHIMSDIPVTALATLSMYFFIRSYRQTTTNITYFGVALMFAIFTLFTKGTGLFLLPLISIYALNKTVLKNPKEILLRMFPLGIFLLSFVADALRVLVTQVPASSWHVFTDPFKIFGWSSQQWTNYLFVSANGANAVFLYPYFYSFGVALFAIIGFVILLTKERRRVDFLFFVSLVMVLWVFTTSPVISAYVRMVFVVYPLIMYFAAVGFQKLKYAILMVPFFVLLTLLPTQGYVPYVQDGSLPSDFIAKMTLMAGVIIGFSLFVSVVERRKPKLNFKLKQLLCAALLILTLSALLFNALYLVNNAPLEVNDSITVQGMGITQAVTWINTNVPQNSIIISNNQASFPFYLSLSSSNYSIMSTPTTFQALLNLINNKQIDYLAVFKQAEVGSFGSYPYMKDFTNTTPPGMQEVDNTPTFVIYQLTA